MSYARFAIYYVPPEGDLAAFGATWLGWDISAGCAVQQFDLPGLSDITMTPRKYGFHGTLKPPFRLKAGTTLEGVRDAASEMAAKLAPATCDGLELTALGSFLALTPTGALSQLQHVAATCVRDLDGFRGPADDDELARRRQAGLSARQEALLTAWGYPYVLEEFRFHLTLSGKLPGDALSEWKAVLHQNLPDLPSPFVLDQIALCGEREDGRFEVLHRYTLAG